MLKPLLEAPEIRDITTTLAGKINHLDKPYLWIILSGGFVFGADLVRNLSEVKEVGFICIKRGYNSQEGPREPVVYHGYGGPHVYLPKYTHVLVDVICEEGLTFKKVISFFPLSYRDQIVTCALILKGTKFVPTLVGHPVSEDTGFLTGYGMGPQRHLPYIAERRNK